jgi:serine protease Do
MSRVVIALLSLASALACARGEPTFFAADAQAASLAAAPQSPPQVELAAIPPPVTRGAGSVGAGSGSAGSGGDAPGSPMPSLAPLVKRLRPVVVNINSKYRPRSRKATRPPGHPPIGPEGGDDEEQDPMERFFRRFQPGPDRRERSGLGSGFLIGDGLVVTNNHVVQVQEGGEGKFRPMDEIKVVTDDLAPGGAREFSATLVGADPKSDLALLRLDDPKAKSLPGAVLGDSDALEVGDWVVAIGEPFGLQATVTAGIVSAKERSQFGGPYSDYLQTDASINPGNSGGPLFNLRGEVVGVNAAIISGANTIGFAIPIAVARQILPQLKERGRVVRGFLGVQPQALTQDMADQLGLKSSQGALVADVVKGGPAEASGLRAGDVITKVNGRPIADNNMLTREVGAIPPGQLVKLDYYRDGANHSLDVKVKARPEDEEDGKAAAVAGGAEGKSGDPLGLTVEDLTADLARRARVDPGTHGVVVTDVAGESAAAAAGLEAGDVLLTVNRKETASVEDYRKAVKNVKKGDALLVRVRRGQGVQFITIKVK